MMNYASGIKIARKKMIMTQAEFAAFLGVSFATVNRWENGLHEPTIKTKRALKPIFEKYGIEVDLW